MLDRHETGRLRYVVEAMLWAGFVVLCAAIGLSKAVERHHDETPLRLCASQPRAAEQWLARDPRPILEEPQADERFGRLSETGPLVDRPDGVTQQEGLSGSQLAVAANRGE